jgi:hypothetical protein
MMRESQNSKVKSQNIPDQGYFDFLLLNFDFMRLKPENFD